MDEPVVKAAGAALDVVLDWSLVLREGEALGETLGVVVVPDEIGGGALGASARIGREGSVVTLTGGRPGRSYLAAHRVRTDRGRRAPRSVVVRIEEEATRC